MKRRLINTMLLCCGGAMALAVGCKDHLPKDASAPDFSLLSLEGKSLSLAQFRGNVVLLGFWAVG